MDENMQTKLDNYLELFDEIRKKTTDSREALALLTEVSKDRRMEEIREEKKAGNSRPATDKQKGFMNKLGIKYPKNVTKQEASVLIDEELGKNNGE